MKIRIKNNTTVTWSSHTHSLSSLPQSICRQYTNYSVQEINYTIILDTSTYSSYASLVNAFDFGIH